MGSAWVGGEWVGTEWACGNGLALLRQVGMGRQCMGRWEWVGTAWAGGNGWALHGHSCREVGMAGQRAFFHGSGNGWAHGIYAGS